jgi:hypothetical protein
VASQTAVGGWARRRRRAALAKTARPAKDAAVVRTIQREAKEHGATLAHDGKGGIDPRIALKVFRRADWRCENPKCPDPKKDLDLDHQSGHPKEIKEDPEARADAKNAAASRDPDPKDDRFLHVLCAACHDRAHDRERAIDQGKKPKPMRGDRR